MASISVLTVLSMAALLSAVNLAWAARETDSCPCVILNLSPDQSARLEALRTQFIEEIKPFQKEIDPRMQQLQRLWSDPLADPRLVRDKQDELFDVSAGLREKMIQYRIKVGEILNPEQVSKLPVCDLTERTGPLEIALGGDPDCACPCRLP